MLLRQFLFFLTLLALTNAQNGMASYFVKQYIQGKVDRILAKIDDNNTCVERITSVAKAAKNKEIWAIKMLDASSKMASGITDGNILNFGSYDECLAVDNLHNGTRIRGKYCLYGVFVSNLPAVITKILDENQFVKNNELFHNGTTIPVIGSICVPDSCSAHDINLIYNASNFENSVSNVSLQFDDRVCQTANEDTLEKWSTWDWMGVAFFAGNGFIILLSTLYHIYIIQCNRKPYHQILLAHSLYQNIKQLLTVKQHPDQIPCINGLRFISIMWIILGHRYLLGGVYPNINALYIIQDWAFHWKSSFITGATVSVDTFFFISGVLVIYIVLLAKSKGIKFNLFHYYLHRYIRLTPAFIAVIILYSSFFKHLGSGPLWKAGVPILTKSCDNHWWQSLLYIQNFLRGGQICVGQTWYLGVDTQLYVLAPLVFLPLRRWPTPTLFGMVIMTLVSCYTGFYIAWVEHANAKLFSGFLFFNKLYSSTIVRLHSWMIGAILGYILFKTKGSKIKMNRLLVFVLWVAVLTAMMFDVCTMTLMFRSEYNRVTSSLYYACSRAIWSIGLAWIVFACFHGYGGLINRILACRLFVILGRLTYSMFLIHVAVLIYILGTGKTNTYFSDMQNMHVFWGDLAFVTIGAVIWSLVFESPIIAIGKILLPEDEAIMSYPDYRMETVF